MLGLFSQNIKKAEKFYTNEHFNGNNKNYQKFVLFSYRRSGTNFFLDLLRSHPEIVAYGGLFGDKLGYIYKGYPMYNNKIILNYREKYPIGFLENNIYRSFSDKIKAVGFKITYEKAPIIINHIKALDDIKIINLRRRNIFRMVLSNMIAVKTQKWHAVDSEYEELATEIKATSRVRIIDDEKKGKSVLPDDFQIYIDYEECVKAMTEIKSYLIKYENFFPQNRTLVLYYEDILSNRKAQTDKALDFLGVEKFELNTKLKKINDKKLYDIIINYDELKTKFENTEWAKFLDD